ETTFTGEAPMSDKTRLLRDADEAFVELRESIDGLSDAEMRGVWLGSGGGGRREDPAPPSGLARGEGTGARRGREGAGGVSRRHLRRLRRVECAIRRAEDRGENRRRHRRARGLAPCVHRRGGRGAGP